VVECRCEVLNVMSGDVARDYARTHLDPVRTDGMGRSVLRCEPTGLEWVEEVEAGGYNPNTLVLRRVQT
jgi:hypothetical protein